MSNSLEATARIKINKLLEEAGWRFFDNAEGKANISLESNVKFEELGDDFEKAKGGLIDFLLLDDRGNPLVVYNSVVTRNYVRIELYINSGDKTNNKSIFDALAMKKDKIEEDFGSALTWERLDNNVTARVKFELTNVSIFNESDWKKMIAFMVDAVPRFERAFKKRIQELNRK
jgi:hypothetical protein